MVKTRSSYCSKTWQKRNNSSNVASILNPKSYFATGKKHCYCFEKNVEPQLCLRPKDCVCESDSTDSVSKFTKETEERSRKKCPKFPTFTNFCRCRKYSRDSKFDEEQGYFGPSSDAKSRYRSSKYDQTEQGYFGPSSEAKSRYRSSKFDQKEQGHFGPSFEAKSRYRSSKYDQEQDFFGNKTLPKYKSSSSVRGMVGSSVDQEEDFFGTKTFQPSSETQPKYRSSSSIRRVVGDSAEISPNTSHFESKTYQKSQPSTKKLDTKTFTYDVGKTPNGSESDLEPESEAQKTTNLDTQKSTLKNLVDFRNDHYFDTHSTEDFLKPVPPHTCVHKFTLDDRSLPFPLNPDVYGSSRCIICGKPMENPPVTTKDEREKQKDIFPKFYKYGLAPKKIYLGGDDVKIQMKVDRWEANKGTQRPDYFNTYALRYQKGVKS